MHEEWNGSPQQMPGRIARAWVNVMGGLTVFSIYMRCSERWSAENVQLAQQLASLIKETEGLWVVGGDWNMVPNELQSHPVFEEIGGVLTAPSRGTCYTNGGWKKYDYFIVHPAMRFHIAKVEVDGGDTRPHLPVRLKLLTTVPGLVQRVPKLSLIHI